VIGWIGTHSTAKQLDMVVPALAELARAGHRFRVRLVGASRELAVPGVEVESVPWSLDTEVEDFQDIDIAIAPMFDDEWSRGKCGFKQIEYMAVGVPMVTSPGGGAREFVEHGVHGLIARSHEEWRTHLGALLTDAALRGRLSRAGRALVEERLSLERQAPVLVNLIHRVIARSRHGAAAAESRAS
jgi:glycosyltransferase involved in cell wall biosynthesis